MYKLISSLLFSLFVYGLLITTGEYEVQANVQPWSPQLTNNSGEKQFYRIGGPDRYSVQEQFNAEIPNQSLDYVIVTSGLNFPDALSSGILNNTLNSTTLLIQDRDSIIQAKINEAKRLLKPTGRVLIVGGPGSVSLNIENLLKQHFVVERIGGKDRISVSVNVANRVNSNPTEIFLTYGLVFSDSLSIVPYATKGNIPIVLQYGAKLNNQVKRYIQAHPSVKKITIVSGTGVIPVSIENELRSLGVTTIERVAGQNRYDTSLLIAKKYFQHSSEVAFSNGYVFADALSGSRFAYKRDMPIILVKEDSAIYQTMQFVNSLNPSNIYFYGGQATVNDTLSDYFQPVINVKDFGADGNGLTDDTISVQQAVNEAANQNLSVYFPPGTYFVKTISLPDNTKMFGPDAVIKATEGQESLLTLRGNNIQINNISISGENKVYAGISVSAKIENVQISKVSISNISQPYGNPYPSLMPSGIRIYEGTKKVVVDSVKIKNVYSKYKWVTGAPPIARGILISPHSDVYSPSEVLIKNSTIDGVGPKDDGDGIVVQLFKTKVDVQIINNTIVNNKKRAIKVQSSGVLVEGNNINNTYRNNNFYEHSTDPKRYDMWSGISVYADDVIVQNNHIYGIGNYGAAIDIADANNVVIKGNRVSNGIKSNYKNGNLISVSKSMDGNNNYSNITISDNSVENGNYGIVIAAKVSNLNVSGNSAKNVYKAFDTWY